MIDLFELPCSKKTSKESNKYASSRSRRPNAHDSRWPGHQRERRATPGEKAQVLQGHVRFAEDQPVDEPWEGGRPCAPKEGGPAVVGLTQTDQAIRCFDP